MSCVNAEVSYLRYFNVEDAMVQEGENVGP